MKQNTRVRLGRLVAVIGCAVAAAIMLCMKPRPALAYSTYDVPCSYSGYFQLTNTQWPSTYYDSSALVPMQIGNADDQLYNGSSDEEIIYENELMGKIYYVNSSITSGTKDVYGMVIMTFGGKNLKSFTDNTQLFYPVRPASIYCSHQYYSSGSSGSSTTLSVSYSDVTVQQYGWYGRTSEESENSWHGTGSLNDYKDGSVVYAVGVRFKISAYIAANTSGSYNYYYVGIQRPVMKAYCEDSDIINALDSIDNAIEQQTNTLMGTTGSGGILSGLTQGGTQTFDSKIGLLGQISDVTDIVTSSFSASTSSTVYFPGISALGYTIIPAQNVNVWQNGLTAWREPCRMICTFGFIVCWVNGMKRVLDYQILGSSYDGTDEP